MIKSIFKVNLSNNSFLKKNEDYLIEFTISGEDDSMHRQGVYNKDNYNNHKSYFLLNNDIFLNANDIFSVSNSLEKVIGNLDFYNLNVDENILAKTIFQLKSNLCKYYRITLLMKDIKRELNFIEDIIYDILTEKYCKEDDDDESDVLEDWFYRLLDYDNKNSVKIELSPNDLGFDLVNDYKNYLKENKKIYKNICEDLHLLIGFKNNDIEGEN